MGERMLLERPEIIFASKMEAYRSPACKVQPDRSGVAGLTDIPVMKIRIRYKPKTL